MSENENKRQKEETNTSVRFARKIRNDNIQQFCTTLEKYTSNETSEKRTKLSRRFIAKATVAICALHTVFSRCFFSFFLFFWSKTNPSFVRSKGLDEQGGHILVSLWSAGVWLYTSVYVFMYVLWMFSSITMMNDACFFVLVVDPCSTRNFTCSAFILLTTSQNTN